MTTIQGWLNWLPIQIRDPFALWWLFMFIPVIIFYFLKLKRPQFVIPSLALWRQVINDQRVNSPFQKFKRNILLLLQLLVLAFLIGALAQPFRWAGVQKAANLPILIDTSASMAALDKAGGTTRLDTAKAMVRELIDGMGPEQQLSLVSFHESPQRLTEFTDNKRILHDALAKLEVTEVPSKVDDALRLAQALTRSKPIDSVLLITDGNVPPTADFDLPFTLDLRTVATGGSNAGITAFNARRIPNQKWEVFVRLEGAAEGAPAGTLELFQDGESAGTAPVTIDQLGSQRLSFRVKGGKSSRLEARFKPDGFDSLKSDNIAYLELPALRALTVYCPIEMQSYRHALAVIPDLQVYPDESGKGTLLKYDLLISDKPDDSRIDATVQCLVGFVPEELKPIVSIKSDFIQPVDWLRNSPVLQHVQLGEIQFGDSPTNGKNIREADYEQRGYEILMHGPAGPLLLQKRNGAKITLAMLAHTDRSTLPYRVGFPVFVANVAGLALQQASLSDVRAFQTGLFPPRPFAPATKFTVTGPASSSTASSNDEGIISGVAAPRVGYYKVSAGGSEKGQIGLSLIDARETQLMPLDKNALTFREVTVEANAQAIKADTPLWNVLAALGLALLFVEWWFFHGRPGLMTAR